MLVAYRQPLCARVAWLVACATPFVRLAAGSYVTLVPGGLLGLRPPVMLVNLEAFVRGHRPQIIRSVRCRDILVATGCALRKDMLSLLGLGPAGQ